MTMPNPEQRMELEAILRGIEDAAYTDGYNSETTGDPVPLATERIVALFTRPTPDGEIGELVDWLRAWLSDKDDDFNPETIEKLAAMADRLETQAADIARLREAGEELAGEVKINKAGLTQALTKRELAHLMDALDEWNRAALATRTDVR